MKIVFIGAVIFSQKMLEKLISLKAEIVGVVTKSKSNFNADFVDLSDIAIKNSIPFKYANDINHPANILWIKEQNPDVIFCFGWSSLIKSELLSLTNIGVIGFHPSLLPNNKGRHPLIWAKQLGLNVTGSTFFFMDEGADSGDILSQKKFSIEFEDSAKDLYEKMINTALSQVDVFFPALLNGTYTRQPQTETGNIWRKRTKKDGLIDFRMNRVSIANLVRGLCKPYPGAHCYYKEEEIIVWGVSVGEVDYENIEPGKILKIESNVIWVKAGDGIILLTEHTFHDMPVVGEYLN